MAKTTKEVLTELRDEMERSRINELHQAQTQALELFVMPEGASAKERKSKEDYVRYFVNREAAFDYVIKIIQNKMQGL